ncbi:MAG: hypothetical protein ACQEXQ_08890 [Bacillota bacterium]
MMTDNQFTKWCIDNKIPEETVKYIDKIRKTDPVRKTRSSIKNVAGIFSSNKMKLTIQFESQIELCGVYEYDQKDSKTIEFYDQPTQIKLDYYQDTGKHAVFLHTPDYLVINNNNAGFVEFKSEERLIKDSEKDPARYYKDSSGTWRSPPAELAAEKHGLSYKIRTETEFNISLQRNVRFLEDYYNERNSSVPTNDFTVISEVISEQPGIQLSELIELCSTKNIKIDSIYRMIVSKSIYFDLYNYTLAEPEYALLYQNEDIAQAYQIIHSTPQKNTFAKVDISIGKKLHWNGNVWTILNPGENEVTLMHNAEVIDLSVDTLEKYIISGKITGVSTNVNAASPALAILKEASKTELKAANFRNSEIRLYLEGKTDQLTSSLRTVRHWLKKFKDAEIETGYGYCGLIPRDRNKGNRLPKLPQETLDIIQKEIEENYETIVRKNRWSVSAQVNKECASNGTIAPSYKTFTKKVKQRSIYLSTKKREGRKAAYQYEEFYFELGPTVPVHGDRPWEIGHIDHTELDIELICSITKKNLGAPWVSFMFDANSRRVLALSLSFDPPSYRSNMLVMNECVRRHSRLPKTIVVDGGKDFHSVYFDTLLAFYGRNKKTRPAGKPRFGSVIERSFGTTNSEFINNLIGNTQSTKDVRKITKETNPKNNAIWTLPAFYKRLCQFCYEIYDQQEHSTLLQSPRDLYSLAMARTGERLATIIQFDQTFYFLTLPTTTKGTAKNEPGKGFKCNYLYYSAEALRNVSIEKQQLPIRYDPFNRGKAYAYVQNRWVECYCTYRYNVFAGRSEKEIEIASTILKQRAKLHGKAAVINQKILADFLFECEEEQITLQKLKDNELKRALQLTDTIENHTTSADVTNHNDTTNRSNVTKMNQTQEDVSDIDWSKIRILEVE